jgi:hypothetical protein
VRLNAVGQVEEEAQAVDKIRSLTFQLLQKANDGPVCTYFGPLKYISPIPVSLRRPTIQDGMLNGLHRTVALNIPSTDQKPCARSLRQFVFDKPEAIDHKLGYEILVLGWIAFNLDIVEKQVEFGQDHVPWVFFDYRSRQIQTSLFNFMELERRRA